MSRMIQAKTMQSPAIVEDKAPVSAGGYKDLATFLQDGGAQVLIEPTDNVLDLGGKLEGVQHIAVNFPVFGDGRGYTHAKRLRDELGYEGELRAVGDLGKDQLHYLARVGFDAFCLREGTDLEDALLAFEGFEHFYRGVRTHGRAG